MTNEEIRWLADNLSTNEGKEKFRKLNDEDFSKLLAYILSGNTAFNIPQHGLLIDNT